MLSKLVIFLPLFAFLIGGLSSRIIPGNRADKISQTVTTFFMVICAICSIMIFYDVWQNETSSVINLFSWINSGALDIKWVIKVDKLTAIMFVVVSLVSCLVHIYSLGYMHEDKSLARFMSYLSLFTFFMLALVSADNFLQLFFGWEGVGVASYLLIGFWFKKQSANVAAIKAFVVNRVGDFGLVMAICLIYLTFGSISYDNVFSSVAEHLNDKFNLFGHDFSNIDAICILLFIGAMGKSAQIGLHVWLADAMEGPTPVSALIHAATMVTAGVFLVARCSPLFEYSEIALNMVTIVGAITAIFAATIAITQNDIKKIIAYSTCSQLGYMFFACGISAYSAAIFHLATHAFFKALLFLGAGSVIHAMHHEQDIRNMGGISKKIPYTYAMMWIGSLALAGFPPFAGFFSKDVILEAAFMSHAKYAHMAYYLGIFAAFLTAFYSWRLLFLVFHNENRGDKHVFEHAHESPKIMMIPLFILAFGSIFSGIFGVKFLNIISVDNNFFIDSIYIKQENIQLLEEIHHAPFLVKISPILVGLVAILLSYLFYIKKVNLANKFAETFKTLYNISYNKWYFDEIYDKLFVYRAQQIGNFFWKIFDVKIIDRFGPNGAVAFCRDMSVKVSKLQTGFLFHYATWMVVGIVVIISIFLLAIKNLIIF